jgi:hypothetical protein
VASGDDVHVGFFIAAICMGLIFHGVTERSRYMCLEQRTDERVTFGTLVTVKQPRHIQGLIHA